MTRPVTNPRIIVLPGVPKYVERATRSHFAGSSWTPFTVVVVPAPAVASGQDGAHGFAAFTPRGLARPSPVVTRGPTIILPGLFVREYQRELGRDEARWQYMKCLAHEVAHYCRWLYERDMTHGPAFQNEWRIHQRAAKRALWSAR